MKKLMSSATTPTNSIIQRLKRNNELSSPLWLGKISLLTLNPTKDKKVVADDKAAAITPASSIAPMSGGIMFNAAHIMVSSWGKISSLLRLTTVAAANSARLLTATTIAAMQAERITTCSDFAIKYRLDCQGLTAATRLHAIPVIIDQIR